MTYIYHKPWGKYFTMFAGILCISMAACSADNKTYLSYKQQSQKTAFGKVTTRLVVNEFQPKSDISIMVDLTIKNKLLLGNTCTAKFMKLSVYNSSNQEILSAFDDSTEIEVYQGNDFNSELGVFISVYTTIDKPENYTTHIEFELSNGCGIIPKKYMVVESFKMKRSKLNWFERFMYSQ